MSSGTDEEISFSEDEQKQERLLELAVNVGKQIVQSGKLVRQPKHTSAYTGAIWVREILEGHEDLCKDAFRMPKDAFYLLCQRLEHHYGLRGSNRMDVEEMVAMFLNVIAHGMVNRNTQMRFGRSGETVSRRFTEVLRAVVDLAMDLIRPRYTDEVHSYIRGDERYYPVFRDCIGAIDGTHIKCVPPAGQSTRFIGRKGYATQNVLAACDWDMCFTFALAGWEGTAHDSRMFNEARTNPEIDFPHPPPGKYYLVDSGFPMPRGYLAPYRRERYHLPDFRRNRAYRNANERFNHIHSSLRSTIERTFGLWKGRFRLLANMPRYSFEMQRSIVLGTMGVHNFIRLHTNEELPTEEQQGDEDDDEDENDVHDIQTQTSGEMLALRDVMRDQLVQIMRV